MSGRGSSRCVAGVPESPVWGLGGRCVRPATPGWGVGLCVCSCVHSACPQPLLAQVRGVGVCVWARVSAAPRHSWLGCWGVCVLVWALRLHPATPGWGARRGCVCLGSGFSCTPPHLAGVLGCVCAGVGAPLAPRHSWLGCAPWVCVFGLRFRLRPATPGWGVGVCVCWCGRSACTPPLLAGVRFVGVCVWARVSVAPRHSWLGCWAACVVVWALCLHPATPGWGGRHGCVCLGSGFACAPPLLAGVLWCLCARVRAPLVPRHSWLGCAVWMCVFGSGFRLRPASPGWGVGVCVCWCACSSCTPPLLAGVCGLPVCAWAQVLAAPRHSWLARWAVCVLVCALCLHPATPGWGARCGCVCLGSGFGCAPPLLAGAAGGGRGPAVVVGPAVPGGAGAAVAGAGGGGRVRAEGGTGRGGGHGAAVARLMASSRAGVVVAGAWGGGWVWAAGGTGSPAGPVGGGGGGRGAGVAYLAASGGAGVVAAGAWVGGLVWPEGGGGGGHGAAVALVVAPGGAGAAGGGSWGVVVAPGGAEAARVGG